PETQLRQVGARRNCRTCLTSSWNHTALEHFICDGRSDLADECLAHLRIGFQHLNRFLFHPWFGSLSFLRPLLPQLLAGGRLVLLDDLFGNPIHYWVVLSVYGDAKQSDRCRKQG